MISSKVTDLIGNTPVLRIAVTHKKKCSISKNGKEQSRGKYERQNGSKHGYCWP